MINGQITSTNNIQETSISYDKSPILSLPPELMMHILSFISLRDLEQTFLVSKQWKDLGLAVAHNELLIVNNFLKYYFQSTGAIEFKQNYNLYKYRLDFLNTVSRLIHFLYSLDDNAKNLVSNKAPLNNVIYAYASNPANYATGPALDRLDPNRLVREFECRHDHFISQLYRVNRRCDFMPTLRRVSNLSQALVPITTINPTSNEPEDQLSGGYLPGAYKTLASIFAEHIMVKTPYEEIKALWEAIRVYKIGMQAQLATANSRGFENQLILHAKKKSVERTNKLLEKKLKDILCELAWKEKFEFIKAHLQPFDATARVFAMAIRELVKDKHPKEALSLVQCLEDSHQSVKNISLNRVARAFLRTRRSDRFSNAREAYEMIQPQNNVYHHQIKEKLQIYIEKKLQDHENAQQKEASETLRDSDHEAILSIDKDGQQENEPLFQQENSPIKRRRITHEASSSKDEDRLQENEPLPQQGNSPIKRRRITHEASSSITGDMGV
ncbi:MAG: F-box protein [Chlamydiales bacterium]|nr:F-box protein [Chlamydiales bacterium]